MQRVIGVAGLAVSGADVQSIEHLQAGGLDPAQQLGAAAQAQVLGQVRTGSASLRRPEPRCTARPCRKPRSIWLSGSYTACSTEEWGRAGTQGGLHTTSGTRPLGEQVGLQQLHLGQHAQAIQVLARAGQSPRCQVGGAHPGNAPARQHGRQHTGAGADVPGLALGL